MGIVQSVELHSIESIQFCSPHGLAFDKNGNLFVSDLEDHSIRKISQNGNMTTFVRKNQLQDVTMSPDGIHFDSKGNLLVADLHNNALRKISADGSVISTIQAFELNERGEISEAKFIGPSGVVVANDGNIYFTEYWGHRVRMVFQLNWTLQLHKYLPYDIKRTVRTVLILALQDSSGNAKYPKCNIHRIPKDVLYIVFKFVVVSSIVSKTMTFE